MICSTSLLAQVVGAQPLSFLSAQVIRHDEALYQEAWSTPPKVDDMTGERPAALQAFNSI